GKKPLRLLAIISSHDQNDFGSLAFLATASAFSPTALNDRPGGSIRPFCEPPTVTSTPHSSCRYSIEPRDEMVSTINSAGCPAASIARRTSLTSVTQPVEVSLCTTHTALISRALSSRSRASIFAGSAPERQSDAMNSGCSPSFTAIAFHSEAKCPASYISTL